MGFDISYHPISTDEMQSWYFDRLVGVREGVFTGLLELGRQRGLEEFYIEKYADTMKVAVQTGGNESFEKTHAYYLAVVQGFFTAPGIYRTGECICRGCDEKCCISEAYCEEC